MSTSDANGWTARDEPITMSKSAFEKSFWAQIKNLDGKLSPKKTISGFTIPLQSVHVGTLSENILSGK